MEQISPRRLRRFLYHLANVSSHYLEGETAQHFLQHHVETLEKARQLSEQVHAISLQIDDLVGQQGEIRRLVRKGKPKKKDELARIRQELAELRQKKRDLFAQIELPKPAPKPLSRADVLKAAQEQLGLLEQGYHMLSESQDASPDRLAAIQEKIAATRQKLTDLSASPSSGH